MGDIALVQPQGVLVASDEQVQVLKRTLAGGKLTDDEFGLFLEVARRSGLDPFKRQIHAVKRWTKNGDVMTIQTGIDGYRALAMRHGLAGMEEPEHTYAPNDTAKRWPMTSKVVVYKRGPSGERDAYVAVARWHEYADQKMVDDGNGGKRLQAQGQWAIRPHVMLDKCAEALALRKGFSEGLGGVYLDEELSRDDGAAQRASSQARRGQTRPLADVLEATAKSKPEQEPQQRPVEPEDESQEPMFDDGDVSGPPSDWEPEPQQQQARPSGRRGGGK